MKKNLYLFLLFTIFSISCENANDLLKKGLISYDNGDYEQSVLYFSKAIEKKPSAMLFFQRANSNIGLSKYNASIEDYSMAINMDKDFYDAYMRRGYIYLHLEQYQNALDDLLYYERVHKDNYDVYIWLGNIFTKMGNLEKADESYSNAIALDPDNTDGYINRGFVALALRYYNDAMDDFNYVLEIDPENELAAKGVLEVNFARNILRNTSWYHVSRGSALWAYWQEEIRYDFGNNDYIRNYVRQGGLTNMGVFGAGAGDNQEIERGTYVFSDNTVVLTSSNGHVRRGRITGNTLTIGETTYNRIN